MGYRILALGDSAAFPDSHPLLDGAERGGDVVIVIGNRVPEALERLGARDRFQAVVVELGMECLGVYTGESRGEEGSNLLGFSRFRLGSDPASELVELVRQPATPQSAVDAAKGAFESAGLKVAVCRDVPGRIVNRLIRPYYNAALRRLDEGLASAADMDTTLKLGLGYPEGPIGLLERTGLTAHYDATMALWQAYGDPGYLPARRAQVAKQREFMAAQDTYWTERSKEQGGD